MHGLSPETVVYDFNANRTKNYQSLSYNTPHIGMVVVYFYYEITGNGEMVIFITYINSSSKLFVLCNSNLLFNRFRKPKCILDCNYFCEISVYPHND